MVLLKDKSRSSAAGIYKTLRVPITHNVRAIVPQSESALNLKPEGKPYKFKSTR
jgi:hypothetical protein